MPTLGARLQGPPPAASPGLGALLQALQQRAAARRQVMGIGVPVTVVGRSAEPSFEEQIANLAPSRQSERGPSFGERLQGFPARLEAGKVGEIGRRIGDVAVGGVQSVVDVATLAGRVNRGEVPLYGPEGDTSPELIREAANVAGTIGSGGLATAGGRAGVGVFGGRLAKTADLEKLKQAETMAAAGADRDLIWRKTGWGEGCR